MFPGHDFQRPLVTDRAGFPESHLCERLLNEGYAVLCLDDFYTGGKANIAHLLQSSLLAVLNHDIVRLLFLPVSKTSGLPFPRLNPVSARGLSCDRWSCQ